jgi:hypothetical protein
MAYPENPSASTKLLVLFIHGLGGDRTTTWGNFPELLRADPDLSSKIDIALFRYPKVAISKTIRADTGFSGKRSN